MMNDVFYAVHAEILHARASCNLVQSRIDSRQFSEFSGASAMESANQLIVALAEAQKQFLSLDEGKRAPLQDQKPLLSNDNEDLTLDTSLRVTIARNCSHELRAKESNIFGYQY
jgi:hypothetical protein